MQEAYKLVKVRNGIMQSWNNTTGHVLLDYKMHKFTTAPEGTLLFIGNTRKHFLGCDVRRESYGKVILLKGIAVGVETGFFPRFCNWETWIPRKTGDMLFCKAFRPLDVLDTLEAAEFLDLW